MPWASACRIARLVADAIGAAHEKGIIHRDLKPGNVFLLCATRTGPQPAEVKVLDFGVAKLLEGDGAGGPATTAGTLPGNARIHVTRAVQRRQPVDHRCDVYSLGCMLFEMIVGQPALHGQPRPRGPGRAQVQEAAFAVGADRRTRRRGSTGLVTRMLAKEPDQRPQAMAEVADVAGRSRTGPAQGRR